MKGFSALTLPAVVMFAALVLAGGCFKVANPVRVYPPPDTFVAPESSIRFATPALPALERVAYENGRDAGLEGIIEIVGGGVACLDYDLDGACDLFFPGGGKLDAEAKVATGVPASLVQNLPAGDPVNRATQARATADNMYTHGVTVADANEDGFPDLLVYGFGGVLLLFNQGDGTFVDATEMMGLEGLPWTTSVAWADFNQDGLLDLYGTCYVDWDFDNNPKCLGPLGGTDVCAPVRFNGVPDWAMLANPGDCFSRADERFPVQELGRGLGAVAFRASPETREFSLYVTNDMSANWLFRQAADGTFHDEAVVAGAAVGDNGLPNASMGIAIFDANNDAQFDMFVTNFDHELMALYMRSDETFTHDSKKYGFARKQPTHVSFGVVTVDLDCDGDEEVFTVAGAVQYIPSDQSMAQEVALYENLEGHTFFRIYPNESFEERHVGRGAAVIDWNQDGFPDVISSNMFGPPRLYVNETPVENHWLRLRLIGSASSRIPIGAIVQVTTESGTMVRQLCGGGSYLSQSQQELFLGLGTADSADITVWWPSGKESQLTKVDANQVLTILERD